MVSLLSIRFRNGFDDSDTYEEKNNHQKKLFNTHFLFSIVNLFGTGGGKQDNQSSGNARGVQAIPGDAHRGVCMKPVLAKKFYILVFLYKSMCNFLQNAIKKPHWNIIVLSKVIAKKLKQNKNHRGQVMVHHRTHHPSLPGKDSSHGWSAGLLYWVTQILLMPLKQNLKKSSGFFLGGDAIIWRRLGV